MGCEWHPIAKPIYFKCLVGVNVIDNISECYNQTQQEHKLEETLQIQSTGKLYTKFLVGVCYMGTAGVRLSN